MSNYQSKSAIFQHNLLKIAGFAFFALLATQALATEYHAAAIGQTVTESGDGFRKMGIAYKRKEEIGASSKLTPRHTFLEMRFKNVVRQDSDYSCGAATLATLMTYHFNDQTTELEVLDSMVTRLSDEEQRKREYAGFSLLDMKLAAEEFGYRAAGYRLSIEQLKQLSAPVIVHVVPLGYKHFAVLRAVVGNRVMLADPSRGNLRMSVERFMNEWSGVVLVLGKSEESTGVSSSFMSFGAEDRLPDKLRWTRLLESTFESFNMPISPLNF